MFYDTILKLCLEKNVKITNVIKDLKMSSGNMARWKNGIIPHGDNLKKLADYFDVSIDYLLGEQKEKSVILSEIEYKLFSDYRSLTTNQQEKVLLYIEFLKFDAENKKTKIFTTADLQTPYQLTNLTKNQEKSKFEIAAFGGSNEDGEPEMEIT